MSNQPVFSERISCTAPSAERLHWVRFHANHQTFYTPLLFPRSHSALRNETAELVDNTFKEGTHSICYVDKHADHRPTAFFTNAVARTQQGDNDEEMQLQVHCMLHYPCSLDRDHDCKKLPPSMCSLRLPPSCLASAMNVPTTKSIEEQTSLLQLKMEYTFKNLNLEITHNSMQPYVQRSMTATGEIAQGPYALLLGESMWPSDKAAAQAACKSCLHDFTFNSPAGFVASPLNRQWLQNGGDAQQIVGNLLPSCVNQLDELLAMRRDCQSIHNCPNAVNNILCSINKLILRCIGGHTFGTNAKLCIHTPDSNTSMLSDTVLVSPSTNATITNAGMVIETSITLMSNNIMSMLMQQPQLLGNGRLLDVHMLLPTTQAPNLAAAVVLNTIDQLSSNTSRFVHLHPSQDLPTLQSCRVDSSMRMFAFDNCVCAIDRRCGELLVESTNSWSNQLQSKLDHTEFTHVLNQHEQLAKVMDTAMLSCPTKHDIQKQHLGIHAKRRMLDAFSETTQTLENCKLVVSETLKAGVRPNKAKILKLMIDDATSKAAALSRLHDKHLGKCRNNKPKLQPVLHCSELGTCHDVVILATPTYNRSSKNRDVLLVHHTNKHTGLQDAVILMVDKMLCTDPEYFSADMRMNACDMHHRSSVRHTLAQTNNKSFVFGSARLLPNNTATEFAVSSETNVRRRQFLMISVKWKENILTKQWNHTTLSFCAANRLANDNDSEFAIARIVSNKFAAVPHIEFNNNWGLRIVHTYH